MNNKKTVIVTIDLNNVPQSYQWYTVATIFNNEESYARNLFEKIDKDKEMQEQIKEVYVPIKYSKKDDKVHKVKGCYSGYVFVRCQMNARLWEILRTTTGAAVILTTGGVPTITPMEDIDEIKKVQYPEGFTRQEIRQLAKKTRTNFEYSRKKISDED